jgi:hypothetical protein
MITAATGSDGFCFGDATFTYFISNQKNDMFEKQLVFFSKNLVINHTRKTSVLTYKNENESMCIIGLCVDSHGCVMREEIPEFIIRNGQGEIRTILDNHHRFAGKYVILYENAHGLYAFADAACELQINYFTGDGVCLSSIDGLISREYSLEISEKAKDIRNGSSYDQPMPYHMTLYDLVKVLLPNHYLDVYAHTVYRYFPDKAIESRKLNDVVERTIFLVCNIIDEYAKYYALVNPLTAGWDSRCNLAFLKKRIPEISCFTHNHPHFTAETADFYLPPMLCKQQNLRHVMFDDLEPPPDFMEKLEAAIGKYHGRDTISYGYSIAQNLPGKAVTNGDIIGTIANDLLGQNVPNAVATPQYFLAKLHNYSKYTGAVVKEHVSEIRSNRFSAANVIDIFAMESRCGRWQAQIHMIYSVLGVNDLNLYNCLELIELWIGLSRKERTQMAIHKEVFKTLNMRLMEIPFNPGKQHSFAYRNPFLFYVATRFKYALNKRKQRQA